MGGQRQPSGLFLKMFFYAHPVRILYAVEILRSARNLPNPDRFPYRQPFCEQKVQLLFLWISVHRL